MIGFPTKISGFSVIRVSQSIATSLKVFSKR
jgi:hypothetical protein